MVPLQLLERGPVAQHHPLGASTGYMAERRGDWEALVDEAMETSTFAVELAALSEGELPGLQDFLAGAPALPFRYLSVHAPVKHRQMSEEELVARLADLPPWVDAIVVHPDVMDVPARYARLGSALVIENMDSRKAAGRTVEELEPLFAALPEAGFCFDVAHAAAVDPTMDEAHRLLDRFCGRLRHLHVSSLDDACHHEPLSDADETAWSRVLRRCRDVPWILEAPIFPM
jgi:Xylose isomerase-like TIM barrel